MDSDDVRQPLRFGLICQNMPFVAVEAPAGSRLGTTAWPVIGVFLPNGKFCEMEKVYRLARKGKTFKFLDTLDVPQTVMVCGMMGCSTVPGVPTKDNLHPGQKESQLPCITK